MKNTHTQFAPFSLDQFVLRERNLLYVGLNNLDVYPNTPEQEPERPSQGESNAEEKTVPHRRRPRTNEKSQIVREKEAANFLKEGIENTTISPEIVAKLQERFERAVYDNANSSWSIQPVLTKSPNGRKRHWQLPITRVKLVKKAKICSMARILRLSTEEGQKLVIQTDHGALLNAGVKPELVDKLSLYSCIGQEVVFDPKNPLQGTYRGTITLMTKKLNNEFILKETAPVMKRKSSQDPWKLDRDALNREIGFSIDEWDIVERKQGFQFTEKELESFIENL